MKLYLVEDFSPEIEFEPGTQVIALTPLVCYQLDKAGISYSFPTDYYDESVLSGQEEQYYNIQLQWIHQLDSFLQENVKELKEHGLRPGFLYYFYLKIILDSIYIHCYITRNLLQSVNPTEVIFISSPAGGNSFKLSLWSYAESCYARVIPLLCRQHNTPFSQVFTKNDGTKSVKPVTAGLEMSFIVRLKMSLAANKLVTAIYFRTQFIYRCLQIRAGITSSKKRFGIFILKLPHIRIDFVIEALKKGHRVYLLSGNKIEKYSRLGTRKWRSLDDFTGSDGITSTNIWQETAKRLDGHDLVNQLNAMYKLDISSLVLLPLQNFILQVCPEFLRYARIFERFYAEEKIDFVITPHEVFPAEFAATAVATHRRETESICLEHGEGPYDTNIWNVTELGHFNSYIASNKETKNYFVSKCRTNNISTRLYLSSHRLSVARSVGDLRRAAPGAIEKHRIYYLPTLLTGDRVRLDGTHYSDTWYFRFQKAIMEYLAHRKEYVFIWKGLPGSDALLNPIPNLIRDKGYHNIRIAINPFIEHLPSADRVICDYPSTGFYESVVAGVPVISLYHRTLKMRPSALKYFGKMLVPFSDASEAIARIEEFLAADPEQYRISLETDDKSITEILEEIKQGSNHE